ncbi:MAG: amidohydrolase family protein [Clostridia bacterium]|nr:amidohydrolase family protein [Clostridia bacterium]
MDYPQIIDVHSHIYPKKIAERAIQNISNFYNVPMQNTKGTSDDLLESGGEIGVKKFVVHSTATVVGQVKSINDFIAAEIKSHKEFIGYATLHPDMTEEEAFIEVERIKKLGLKGIKLHADFQRFDIDEPRAENLYRAINGTLPVLFHTGDDRFDYSSPERLARAAKKFPNMLCIAAHFGGYCRWSEIDAYDGLDNVYFDTCSSLFKLPDLMAKDIMNHLGHDRFMFGCDFPMWRHKEEVERFLKLQLGDAINENVLANNAVRILGIQP